MSDNRRSYDGVYQILEEAGSKGPDPPPKWNPSSLFSELVVGLVTIFTLLGLAWLAWKAGYFWVHWTIH